MKFDFKFDREANAWSLGAVSVDAARLEPARVDMAVFDRVTGPGMRC